MMEKVNRIKECVSQNKFIISIFVIIFILLAFQHGVVNMYFDDYGNASLAYGKIIKGVSGTNYTFSQIIEWAIYIYNNWGGRILYAICFVIPLLKNGATSYMMMQAVVMLLMIYFMYKIATYKNKGKNKNWYIPIIIFALYNLLDMSYLRHGVYWASASVLYIWPLLPFMMLIYIYMIVSDKIKNNEKVNYALVLPIMLILNIFATFSQEQVGIAVIAFEISYIICHHIKDIKKFLVIDIFNLLVSLSSYLLLFLAPGNWVRMDSNAEFASLSLFGKIFNNYPIIMSQIFTTKGNIYMLILGVLTIYMIFKLIKRYYTENKKYLLLLIPLIVMGIEVIVLNVQVLCNNKIILSIFSTLCLISMFIVAIIYFYKNKYIEFSSIYVAAACSAFCLLMSPSLINRTFLPFIMLTIIIIAKLVSDALCDTKYIRIGFSIATIVISISAITNYINIYKGYQANYNINNLNMAILENYDSEKDGKVINLYKVEDIWYGSEQPYDQPSMYVWIKEYFNLPEYVEFNWIDIYENIR